MRVKATQKGFKDNLKEVGATFDVTAKEYSESWMEKVSAKEPEPEKEPEQEAEA